MSNLIEYRGYHGSVEFSAEDECFVGKVEFINDLITFDGTDVASLTRAFRSAVDDYLAFCAESGAEPNVSFKGTFNIRMDPDLHRRAVIEAKKAEKTLNAFVCEAVAACVEARSVVHNHHQTIHVAASAPRREWEIEVQMQEISSSTNKGNVEWTH